jgi:hypothetical protein
MATCPYPGRAHVPAEADTLARMAVIVARMPGIRFTSSVGKEVDA